MDDPEEVEFAPPLPDNALAATVTFLAARGGLAPGYRTVPRSQATHAELVITGLSGKPVSRRVELGEAEAWLAEVRALHARHATLDAADRTRTENIRQANEEVAAQISPTCPHCDVPREYVGRHHLMTAGAPEHLAASGEFFGRIRASAIVVEQYACPRCGSLELFRPLLPHPLPATQRPG